MYIQIEHCDYIHDNKWMYMCNLSLMKWLVIQVLLSKMYWQTKTLYIVPDLDLGESYINEW